jgi:uncharacterized tellurite resistance protein B-like protein
MAISDLSSVLQIFGESTPDEAKQQQLFAEVLLMTLARASNSDANIDPVEISTIQGIMKRETGEELTSADIRKASRPELYESQNLRKYLRSVQRKLSAGDCIRIVQALAEVIRSDSNISVLEIDFFNRVSDALQVTPAGLAGLVA